MRDPPMTDRELLAKQVAALDASRGAQMPESSLSQHWKPPESPGTGLSEVSSPSKYYWSDRRAVLRSRSGTGRPTSVSTRQTTPVCEVAPDPGSDTAGPSPPPRNPSPAIRPSRCPRTTAGAGATHCRGRADNSLPLAVIPSPNSLPHALLASAAA